MAEPSATYGRQQLWHALKTQAWEAALTCELLNTFTELYDVAGADYAARRLAAHAKYTSEIMALLVQATRSENVS